MKKFLPRYLLRALALTVALLCWIHVLILSGDMVKSANSVSFLYETDGVPSAAVSSMLEDGSVSFAAWMQKKGQSVREQEFARNTTVQVLEVVGDAELVLSPERLLHGFLPVRDIEDGCAVDAATAYTLWGGTDVTGEVLIYDDKEYTVTGVFSQPENTMFIQGRIEKGILFPHLELSVSGAAIPRQQADEIRTRYSIPEPDVLTDHVETAAILHQLTLLQALLVAAILLWKTLRRSFGKPVSSLGRASFAIAMVAGILISALAIGFSPVIPAAAISGRWSDFSFWSALMEDIVKQAKLSNHIR